MPAPVGGKAGEFIIDSEQQWRQPAMGNTSTGGLTLTRQHAIKSTAGLTSDRWLMRRLLQPGEVGEAINLVFALIQICENELKRKMNDRSELTRRGKA